MVSTVNPTNQRLDCLDRIRGVAILLVFLYHCLGVAFHTDNLPWNGWFRSFSGSHAFLVLLPLSYGWAGVAIFFVVSGFCIHLSFERQGREWKSFFTRRFFRIYPPYALALLVFALIFPGTRLDFSAGHDGWRQLVSHLLLIHNYDPQLFAGVNGAFWSIAVEAQLYLLYPLLFLFVARYGWRRTVWLLAGCELSIHGLQAILDWLFSLGASLGPKTSLFVFNFSLLFYLVKVSPFAYWFSWSLGAFIADEFLKGRPLPLVGSSFWFWLAVALGSYLVKPLVPFAFMLFAVATAIAISKSLNGRPPIRIPKLFAGFIHRTGVWSYSIYLLHQPLINQVLSSFILICPQFGHNPVWRFSVGVISWVAIMPLGAFWYRCCERPSIAVGKRLLRQSASRIPHS